MVMANRFLLRHHELKIEYDVGRNPGFTALTYDNGGDPVSFKTDEVSTSATALGELVSVPLRRTVDTGGELFGFFVPAVDVPDGEQAAFTTTGIYARFSGPDSFPHRPESWHTIELRGVAESVKQPE
jgi:hypothetical protein